MNRVQNGNDTHISLKRDTPARESIQFWFLGKDMEPASGIEPPTYDLRNRCSTTELRRLTTEFEL